MLHTLCGEHPKAFWRLPDELGGTDPVQQVSAVAFIWPDRFYSAGVAES